MGAILELDQPVFPLSPSTSIAPQWQDGLVLAWVGARGIYTLFPSLRGSATDLETFKRSPYGDALQTNDSATNSGLTLPGFRGLGQTDNITLFALTAEPSLSAPTAAYSQRSPSAGNANLDLALNRSNNGATSAGTVSMLFRSTGAANRGARFDGVLDGQWHAIAISHLTGSSYIASFDGGQRTAAGTNAPTGTIITGDEVVMIGGRNNLTEGVRGPLAIVFAWERPWAQRDLDRITADPAQLFAPKRIWVPVSAGGGDVTVNLSGVSAAFAQTSPVISSTAVLSGESATASAGIVLPAFSFTLSGQAAAAAAGGLSPSFSRGLSGQSATFAAGSVVPSVAVAIIGLQAAFAAGTLTASSSGGDTAALTGEVVSFAQTAPSISVTVALTGITATMAAGLLSAASGTATITVKAGSWLRYKKLS